MTRALLPALLVAGCVTPRGPAAEGLDVRRLDQAIGVIAGRARPGTLGMAVKDLTSGVTWSLNGSRAFPMQSVFKLPLGAVVLSHIDRGALSLDDTVVLSPEDLSPPYSPISAAYPERVVYTIGELLRAASGGSDNTAADVLMARVGGPAAVTRWLAAKGIRGMRVDRYERQFQIELNDMPPFRPAWATDSAFLAALNQVPQDRRRRATRAYLADARDTSTPMASAQFLERLVRGELLSPRSTAHLLRIATETGTGARRIKAALPAGATVAHKTGSARPDLGMNPAINDIGIVTLHDGRQIVIALYLSASTLPYQEAETLLADATRAVLAALR